MQIATSNKIYLNEIVISNRLKYLRFAVSGAAYIFTNLNTMCPALIFAANRKDRVNGRTEILVVSIKIRNGFSHVGAPSGKK